MSDDSECPSCRSSPWGGQIVELSHPSTDSITYAVICPNCGTVYEDAQARKQMEASAGEE